MGILYFFEKIRNPFLDGLFYGITQMGDEIFFLAVALVIFWCINKKMGYFLMSTCFFGIVLNQFLKLAFKIPRPWVAHPDFHPVSAAIGSAAGYSFPSGHTQNAVSIFGCLFAGSGILFKNKRTKVSFCILCTLFAAAVSISRMYLGVHTLQDVLFSAVLAVIMVIVFRPVFLKKTKNSYTIPVIIGIMLVCSVAYLFYSHTLTSADLTELENILSGQKHAWYMLGGVLGILVFYPLERKFINFDPKTTLGIQLIKIIPGFILAVALKELMKIPLDAIFSGHGISHAIRYFTLVAFAVFVWPLCFKQFEKLKKNK